MTNNKDLQLYDFKNKQQCMNFLVKENLNKLYSMFKYEGLPENITKRNIETYLLRGHCEFIEEKGQLWPMRGGLCGVNRSPVYDYTQATIANPALNISKTYTDGVDCVIVRNDPLYMGVHEILRRYCSIIAEGNLSLYMWSSFGSRVSGLISADDDNTKKSADKFIENVIRGEYSVIGENAFFEGIKVNPLTNSSNNILQLLEMLQYTQAELLKALGLSSNNNRKREALSSEETSSDELTLLPLIDVMLEERQLGIEKVNKLFGTNIKVSKASSWEYVEEEIENSIEEEEESNEDSEETTEDKEEKEDETEE